MKIIRHIKEFLQREGSDPADIKDSQKTERQSFSTPAMLSQNEEESKPESLTKPKRMKKEADEPSQLKQTRKSTASIAKVSRKDSSVE